MSTQSPLPPVLEIRLSADPAGVLQREAFELISQQPDITARFGQSGHLILGASTHRRLMEAAMFLRREGEVGPALRYQLIAPSQVDYSLKRQHAGRGDFARVMLQLSPAADGRDDFENRVGREVPNELLTGVAGAIQRAAAEAFSDPVAGYRAVLTGGAYHDVDSSLAAFEEAAFTAFEKARAMSGLVRCEPMAHVEVDILSSATEEFANTLGEASVPADVSEGMVRLTSEVDGQRLIACEHVAQRLGATLTAHFSRYRPCEDGDDTFRPAMGARVAIAG
ncbi:MAG: hypothetical protein AB7O49_19410 [Sphingomonadales bacterium]